MSAILVLIADKAKPHYVWIGIVPIALFWVLDAYYLALERSFRSAYNSFLKELHEGSATVDDVFMVNPSKHLKLLGETVASMFSISILPFYAGLALMIEVARRIIIK